MKSEVLSRDFELLT